MCIDMAEQNIAKFEAVDKALRNGFAECWGKKVFNFIVIIN